MKKRTTKKPASRPKVRTYIASNGARLVGQDPRITEALTKLDGALLCALSDTVGVAYTGGMTHNLAIAARAATDIRGILMLGGDS